jgi:hypothetical protein
MSFHRLTTPIYFGGMPGGYDWINNGGSGTPANTDNAKAGGPNAGTYFDAFGEDATSANANRGNKALAQNTDFIDDLLHRDLAVNTRTADVTPGGPVTSITIVGPGIFLGGSGDELQDLFHITDANDDDIEITGTKIAVASITSGGALGSGFSAGNVTVLLTVAIPTGQTYRVWYGTRSNLAGLPADAFTTIRIRSAIQVDSQTEELFRLLHGNSEAWNAAWDNTIYGLNQGVLEIRTLLASLHGNAEVYNAAWDNTIYDLDLFNREFPAVNFNEGYSTPSTILLKHGHFYPIDQIWFATGDGGNDFLGQSNDFGKTWVNLGPLGTNAINTGFPLADVNTLGTSIGVMLEGTRTTVSGVRTAYGAFTFTNHATALSHNVSIGELANDNSKFVACYRSGSAGIFIDTSPDAATWTAQTVPAPWSGYTGTHSSPVIKGIPGLLIAAFLDEGTSQINIMKSTNSGVTWTNVQTPLAGGMTAATSQCMHPAYDPKTGNWFVVTFDSTSNSSQLLKSTDSGATWIQGSGPPSVPFPIQGVACMPGVRVYITSDQRIIITTDDSFFYLVGANTNTNPAQIYIRDGGGGLLTWNSADKKVWASTRLGNNTTAWNHIF